MSSESIGVEDLVGKRVTAIRYMTFTEARGLGWELDQGPGIRVLELEGGVVVTAARDPECNGPGSFLFDRVGTGKGGK